jgi:excisionase family DNA binding protein
MAAGYRGVDMELEVQGDISTIKKTSKSYENEVSCSERSSRNENLGLIFENLIWLTSKEASTYLRLPSVGALRVMVCKRQIPFHKLGRSLRFKRSELDRFIESSRNGGF